MKTILSLILSALFLILVNTSAQNLIERTMEPYSNNGIINPVLGDSSDLPGAIWNGGNFGGSVSFGTYSGNNIYFTQGNTFYKAEEGTNSIQTLERGLLLAEASAFNINDDNLYLIYKLGTDRESDITKTTLSNLGSSSSTQFSEITNGINKFDEIDGYVFLAHNKNSSVSDKLVGEDFLNSTQTSFVYTQDFIDFTVNGSYAYIIADNGTTTRTIEVVDFSNKSNVIKVGEVVITSAEKLAYSNGHLFIACSDNQGMQVVDVSTPTNPNKVGNYKGGTGSFSQVAIEGTKAYLKNRREVVVVNISTPSTPTKITSNFLHDLHTSFEITDVVNGKVYYVDNGAFGIIETDSWVRLGQQYFSPTSSEKVFSDGNNLVVQANYGYKYYFATLEDKYSPSFYSAFSIDDYAEDFLVNGNYFYLIDYSSQTKLYIHELSNLSSTPLATYTYPDYASSSKVDGNLAVIGGDGYFEIINLTDKSNPTQHYSGNASGTIHSIEFSDDKNTLYLIETRFGPEEWFVIYDMSNKAAPVKISEIKTPHGDGEDAKMEITDSTVAIVSNEWTGFGYSTYLYAYDISDPANISSKERLKVSSNEFTNAIFLEGLIVINVPQDYKLYTYTLLGSSGIFVAGDTFELDNNELQSITGFIDHQSGARNIKSNNIMGEELETGYVYCTHAIDSLSNLIKTIGFTKTKKENSETKVQLTTAVLPAEASSDGCAVSPSGGEYDKNKIISMSANAATGWVFDKWSGDLSGSANPSNLTMDDDKNVTGNFKPILEIGFASEVAKNICPPTNEEKVFIGTTSLTAYGVDWQLITLDYLVTTKVKAEYAGAFLKYKNSDKKIQGTIHEDDNGYMTGLNFAVPQLLPELSTYEFELYFMFDFPPNERGFLSPLSEVKKLGVSINRTQVNANPVISVEGVKEPQETFTSKIQNIGSIWNTSLSPSIPFATIQDANDDPRTEDGHTINICEGFYEYDKTVKITKAVTIEPHSEGDEVYIKGNEQSIYGPSVFYIDGPTTGVTVIKGLTFENAEEGHGWTTTKCIEANSVVLIEQNKFICSQTRQTAINIVGGYERYNTSIIKNNEFLQSNNQHNSEAFSSECDFGNIRIENNSFDMFKKAIFMRKGRSELIIENNEFLLCETDIYLDAGASYRISKNELDSIKIVNGACKIDSNYSKYGDLKIGASNYSCEILSNYVIKPDKSVRLTLEGLDNCEIVLNENLEIIMDNVTSLEETSIIKNNNCKSIYIHSSDVNITDNTIEGDGIIINSCSGSKIINNKILYSKNNGISISKSNNINILNNTIYDAGKHGIYSYKSNNVSIEQSKFRNISNSAIRLDRSSSGPSVHYILRNEIKHNKEKIAILVTNLKEVNFNANNISNASHGIYAKYIDNASILNNNFNSNGTAITTVDCRFLLVRKNNIENSTDDFTGIHLDNTVATIEDNNLTANNGAAIGMFNNSGAEINGNNIYDNPNLAVFSDNPNTVVNVDDNYWGGEQQPLSDIFEGNIELNTWLTEPLALVVSAEKDSIITANSITDSISIAIENFVLDNDQAELTFVDEKGWLVNGETHTLEITDSLVATYMLKFAVPSDAGSNFNNKVTISAVSLTNSEMTAIDSFYILNYTPELALIRVSPDSISLALGDSLQFRAYVTDQYEKEFVGTTNYTWSVSAGTIDSAGYFRADSTQQVITITATETISNLSASANINVQPHTNIAEIITIYPDSIVVQKNETIQFYTEGKDANGFDVEFNKLWIAVGGTIDSVGYFTAGDTDGEYFVKVQDAFSGAEATAKVIVGTPTSVESERIIPREYSLNQNYPNPFNPSTTISYALPFDSKVKVEIFNMLGQRVDVIANGVESAGLHSTLWDATHLASGVYIIRINATSTSSNSQFTKAIKMILMK